MTDWTEVPGYGYRVHNGERIRIETMMYNPTDTSYEKAYLEVVIPFQETPGDASAAARERMFTRVDGRDLVRKFRL